MTLWQVMYADWEMECCGTPFSVGVNNSSYFFQWISVFLSE